MTFLTDVGWRHRKRHCASWHSTLTKLTLPHDANSVVQNKKGTKPKLKKKTQNAHKGDGAPCTLLTTLPFLAVVCAFARWRHFAAEPRMLMFFGSMSTPTSQFALNGSVCAHETTDER